MEYYTRIKEIAEHFGFRSVNEFATKGLNYTSSEKINRLKKENTKPSIDIIINISNKFENINSYWILTGEGTMLKNEQKTSYEQVLNYLKDHMEDLIQDNKFNYIIDYIITKKEEIKQRNKIEALFEDFKARALKKS